MISMAYISPHLPLEDRRKRNFAHLVYFFLTLYDVRGGVSQGKHTGTGELGKTRWGAVQVEIGRSAGLSEAGPKWKTSFTADYHVASHMLPAPSFIVT